MKKSRRRFIQETAYGMASISLVGAGCQSAAKSDSRPQVMTVAGSIAAHQMGITLPHEHLLVDFIGAAQTDPGRYDPETVFAKALPHLEDALNLGVATFVDCTPAYIGRDPRLLRRLAGASRLQILTNTGYYGAGKNKFLPAHAFEESEDQLAARWILEATEGIQGTGIRPGFVKTGVDAGPLSAVHQKLVRAAARTHRHTGLVVAAHTGDGEAALAELKIIDHEGLAGSSFIWVHAQNEKDSGIHVEAARQGAWVEFDGISPTTIARHVDLVRTMRDHGLLSRVLISHDAGWYHVGEPGGGSFRGFETLFTEFLPALRTGGFSENEIEQLIVRNPQSAFSIRDRTKPVAALNP